MGQGSDEKKQQLFENHECAKLGFNEKVLSSSWDFWNLSSDSFRNFSLQKNRTILQLVLLLCLVVIHPHHGCHHLSLKRKFPYSQSNQGILFDVPLVGLYLVDL
jgi:hypothetical protein